MFSDQYLEPAEHIYRETNWQKYFKYVQRSWTL